MKKISFKKSSLLEAGIFLSLIGVISFGIFYLFSDIKNSSQKISSQKEKISSLEQEKREIFNLRKEYQKELPRILKANSMFLPKEDPLPFIQFLENLSPKENFSLEINSTSQDKKGNLLFNITTVSSYPDFFKFLVKLEKGPYLIEIKDLQIKRLTEKEIKKEKELSGFKEGYVRAKISFVAISP